MLQKKTITPRNTNIIKAHQLNTWNSAVTSNIQICRNSSARDVSQYGRQQELTSPDTFTTSDSSIYSDVSNRHKALKRMQHRISFLESFKLFGTIFIILGFAGLAFTLYFIGEFVTPATSFNSLLTIAMSAVLNGVLQTLRLINILHKALNNISDAANGVGLTKFEMKLGLATSAATPSEIHHKS